MLVQEFSLETTNTDKRFWGCSAIIWKKENERVLDKLSREKQERENFGDTNLFEFRTKKGT